MKKNKAMQRVMQEIDRLGYQYQHIDYFKDGHEGTYLITEVDTVHLSFDVGEPWRELQITLAFSNDHFDVLAFPHPQFIQPEYLQEVIRVTNCIDSFLKIPDCSGKFYVDEEYRDFAYSARISYRYFEIFPETAVHNGVFGYLPFVADIGIAVYQVANGIISSEECCRYITSIWNNDK